MEPKQTETTGSKTKINQHNFIKRNPRFNAALLSFLVVAFSVGGYFVYSSFAYEGPTDFNDKADTEAQVKALTASVKLRSSKYAYSKKQHASDETKNKDTVAHVAAQRRLAMRKLMLTKPEAASTYVLPDEAKNNLPDDTKKSVEARVSLEGTWTTSMDERFDAKTGKITSAKPIYSITTKDSNLNVVVAKVPDNVRHLDTVTLSGVTIDGMVAVGKDGLVNKQLSEQTNQKIAKLPMAAKLIGVEPVRAAVGVPDYTPYNPTALGTKEIAVYMVNFTNDKAIPSLKDDAGTVAPMSVDILQKFLSSDSNSVKNYFLSQSGNLFNPNFTIHDWYTASTNNNVDCTNYAEGLLTDSFLASLGNAIDTRDKSAAPATRLFLFNRLNCTGGTVLGAGATGSFPKPITGDIQNIRFVQTGATKQWFTAATTHEIGHTLGLFHAQKDATGSADDIEYGDIYDVMGRGTFGESAYFDGYRQTQLGWLNRKPAGGLGKQGLVNYSLRQPTPLTANNFVDFTLIPFEANNSYSELGDMTYAKVISLQSTYQLSGGNEYLNIEYRTKLANNGDLFDKFYIFNAGDYEKAFDPEPGVIIYRANIAYAPGGGFTTRLVNPIFGSTDYSKGHILRSGETYFDTANQIKISLTGTGVSSPSSLSTAKVRLERVRDTSPPAQPTKIKVTPLTSSAEASWANPTSSDYAYSAFNIYQYEGTKKTKLTCAGQTSSSRETRKILGCKYFDRTKFRYTFTMTAYDTNYNAAPETSEIEFKPLSPPPLSFFYIPSGNQYVDIVSGYYKKGTTLGLTIKWSGAVKATSYIIRRNDGKEFEAPPLLNQFTDTTVQPNQFYTYYVYPKFEYKKYIPIDTQAVGICSWRAERYEWFCGKAIRSDLFDAVFPDLTNQLRWEYRQ